MGPGETPLLSPRTLLYPHHDHAPLKWMATANDTNARVTRWFLALQDYHFQLFNRPARAHAKADALSRRDACLGLTRGTPGLLLRVGVCGNPTPADLEETLQRSEQRPLYGHVVPGRYIPFNTAVTAHQSSRHRQSWGLRSPGGRRRQWGIKGRAHGSQGREKQRRDRHTITLTCGMLSSRNN